MGFLMLYLSSPCRAYVHAVPLDFITSEPSIGHQTPKPQQHFLSGILSKLEYFPLREEILYPNSLQKRYYVRIV